MRKIPQTWVYSLQEKAWQCKNVANVAIKVKQSENMTYFKVKFGSFFYHCFFKSPFPPYWPLMLSLPNCLKTITCLKIRSGRHTVAYLEMYLLGFSGAAYTLTPKELESPPFPFSLLEPYA